MNVFAVGEDNALKAFVKLLLPEQFSVFEDKLSERKHAVLEISHSDTSGVLGGKEKNGRYVFDSVLLLFGVRVLMDLSGESWTDSVCLDETELILFLSTFPYTEDSFVDDLVKIQGYLLHYAAPNNERADRERPNQFRVVFVRDPERKTAESDVVNEEEALDAAPYDIERAMENKLAESEPCLKYLLTGLIDFKTLSSDADLAAVFSRNCRIAGFVSSFNCSNFQDWRLSLEDFMEEYKITLENDRYSTLTDMQEMTKYVFRFEDVKGSLDLFETYAKRYLEQFWGKVQSLALEKYEGCIADLCFWDIKRDKDLVAEKLLELYHSNIRSDEPCSCPKLQSDYNILCHDKKIDIGFFIKIKRFINEDVPNLLFRILKNKEGIISEYCVISER